MNRIKGKTMRFMSISFIISLLWFQMAWALPQEGSVTHGASSISQPNANTMHINQTTPKSIINWQGYSIGTGQTVQYFQPNSGSISLNRVTGVAPSEIFGQLLANGQVWVINPNGLLVGEGASINVGSFLSSTLNITNEGFINGNYTFINTTGSLSSISNSGNITSAQSGYVVLISPSITNEGNISSNLGKAYLVSADEVTLNFAGNDLIGFTIDKAAAASALGINNSGTITADGGQAILSARVAGDILKSVVNNTGIIQAQTIGERDGRIYLLGGMENKAIIENNAISVTIHTILSSAGATPGSGDIHVNDAISWSANTTLVLSAYRNVNVNSNITATGNEAGLTLTPNTGGTGAAIRNVGLVGGYGVTCLTTAQMMQFATFNDAGWSIANTGGSSSSIWRIYEGKTLSLTQVFSYTAHCNGKQCGKDL